MKKTIINAVFYGVVLFMLFVVTNNASFAAAQYTGDPGVLSMTEQLSVILFAPLWVLVWGLIVADLRRQSNVR